MTTADVSGCEQATSTCPFRPRIAAFADQIAIDATVLGPGDQWHRRVVARSEGTSHTVPVRLLPWITDVAFDPAEARLSWRASAGEPADATMILLSVFADRQLSWLLFASPGVESRTLPDLTAVLGASAPDFTTVSGISVSLLEIEDVQDYAQYRARAEPLAWALGAEAIAGRGSHVR